MCEYAKHYFPKNTDTELTGGKGKGGGDDFTGIPSLFALLE